MNSNKAYAGAIISGLTTLLGMLAMVDFSASFDPNTARDVAIVTIASVLAGFGGVWATPNKAITSTTTHYPG